MQAAMACQHSIGVLGQALAFELAYSPEQSHSPCRSQQTPATRTHKACNSRNPNTAATGQGAEQVCNCTWMRLLASASHIPNEGSETQHTPAGHVCTGFPTSVPATPTALLSHTPTSAHALSTATRHCRIMPLAHPNNSCSWRLSLDYTSPPCHPHASAPALLLHPDSPTTTALLALPARRSTSGLGCNALPHALATRLEAGA